MLIISINFHHLGIPLTLVTVAAIAKSLTEFCFKIHYKLWEVWIRFRVCDPNDPIKHFDNLECKFGTFFSAIIIVSTAASILMRARQKMYVDVDLVIL